jgi:DNA-directed RNA polymerase subunit RPC12/RpoP
MDENPSTYICENCSAKIIYHGYEEKRHLASVPVISCPVCGAIIPELGR